MSSSAINANNRQRIRFKTFYYTSFLGAALMLYIAILAFLNESMFAFLGNALGFFLLLFTAIQANRDNPPYWVAYPFAVFLIGYLTVLSIVGYHKGEALIWLLATPPLTLLILGTRLGAGISLYMFALLCYGFFYSGNVPDVYMNSEFKVRLCFAYLLITTLCYSYSVASDANERELREAALRIENLEQLLPMCSHCKKVHINEDWSTIETYLMAKETMVSHGICPGCLMEHYGETMDDAKYQKGTS